MVLRTYTASWEKLASSLSYLVFLLCLSAFSGNAGYTPPLNKTSVASEIVFSGHQQVRETVTWQSALAAFNLSHFSAAGHQAYVIQLSYLHDRQSKVAYTYLSTQYIAPQPLQNLEQLKTIPQSSDEHPLYLSRG